MERWQYLLNTCLIDVLIRLIENIVFSMRKRRFDTLLLYSPFQLSNVCEATPLFMYSMRHLLEIKLTNLFVARSTWSQQTQLHLQSHWLPPPAGLKRNCTYRQCNSRWRWWEGGRGWDWVAEPRRRRHGG